MTQHVLNESGRRARIAAVAGDEQYVSALARCEALARNKGHSLGVWYPVSTHLHASPCEGCGTMVWVTRPGTESHWRIGGSAFEQECLDDDWRSVSGD